MHTRRTLSVVISSVLSFRAQGLLFDNDGVLVDSHPQVVEAWTHIAADYGLDIDHLLNELIGVRAEDTLRRYLPADELTTAVTKLEQCEIDLAAQTAALAGAQALLASLRPSAWTVVTSATAALAKARWVGAGITLPDRPVTADDVTRGKPDPEPYLIGADILGVDPATCIVFEDSPAGGLAGQAAGATVIAVGDLPWSFDPAARVRDLRQVEATIAASGEIEIRIADGETA